jgi:hypothetical protein
MQALSKTKRNIYFTFLSLLFVFGTPFIMLYSIGYRLGDIELLEKTGGITIVLRESGSELYIDEEYKRDTNFLQKIYFFQSIKVGTHGVRVVKDGFQEWKTEVQVYPELVSETYPLLIKEKVAFNEIPIHLGMEDELDETEVEENEEYIELQEVFEDIVYESQFEDILSYKNVLIRDNGGDFTFVWDSENKNAPYYFCGVFECRKKITVRKPTFEKITAYDFYPGRDDALVILTDSGLYAMQIDNEQRIQVFTLYNGENIDFYIENRETIYINDGELIGFLEL